VSQWLTLASMHWPTAQRQGFLRVLAIALKNYSKLLSGVQDVSVKKNI